MKRKLCCTLLLLFTFTIFIGTVKASKCNDTELSQINKDASNVKVSYEIKSKEIDNPSDEVSDTGHRPEKITIDYITVTILNLTDNTSIKITNSVDGSVRTFTSADATNGTVSYDIENLSDIAKLDYTLYTSAKTNCAGEDLFKNELTLPKYNSYYQVGPCVGESDAPECQKYVTTEVTPEAIESLYDKQVDAAVKKASENDKKNKEDKSFIEKNKKTVIIGGSIIIVMGAVATAVVIGKRRSRLI